MFWFRLLAFIKRWINININNLARTKEPTESSILAKRSFPEFGMHVFIIAEYLETETGVETLPWYLLFL